MDGQGRRQTAAHSRVWVPLLCTLLSLAVLAAAALAPRLLVMRADSRLLAGFHSIQRQGGRLDMPAQAGSTIEAMRLFAGYYGTEAQLLNSYWDSGDAQWHLIYEDTCELLYKLMGEAEIFPPEYTGLLYECLGNTPYEGHASIGMLGSYSYNESLYSLETGSGLLAVRAYYVQDNGQGLLPLLLAAEFGSGVLNSLGIPQPDDAEMQEYLWNYITLLGLDNFEWEYSLYVVNDTLCMFADSGKAGFSLVYGVTMETGTVVLGAVPPNQHIVVY